MAVCKPTRETVLALKAAGATYREIAALTGLAMHRVNRIINPPPKIGLKRKTRPRECLCCGATFQSEGPHHRMCERCRKQSASPFDTPATVWRR